MQFTAAPVTTLGRLVCNQRVPMLSAPHRQRFAARKTLGRRGHTDQPVAHTDHLFARGLGGRPRTMLGAPNGGSVRVLQSFSITQRDVNCKLAGIRPVADGSGQP